MKKLVDTLPPSLQTLTLERGLDKWEGSTSDMIDLLRGITKAKERYLPNLTKVGFLECPHFEELMPHEIKVECRSAGVALEYTSYGSDRS